MLLKMHTITYKLKTLTDEYKEKGYTEALIKNLLKEYLQDILLSILYNDEKFKDLIFYGGTCLRKLYNINRLSEDIDFESHNPIDLNDLKTVLLEYFKIEKLDGVSASIQKGEHVNRCTLKFEILHNLGLSDHQNEKLHVKVEINENPLGNFSTELTPYTQDTYSCVVRHYPLETLMAGKMIACISRVYKKGNTGVSIKGRDFYDLIWYMQKGVSPNEKVFRSIDSNKKEVFEKLDNIVKDIKSKDLLIDLEPLFENHQFIVDWCDNFHEFYNKYRKSYN
jgi:predicted nucleotidyltransferase component of viral defense system